MTIIPSFFITAGLLFLTPQLQTRIYTKYENKSLTPPTWSICETPFLWLTINCGTITQSEIISRAKPTIRDFSDSTTLAEPYTASYALNYPSDASSEKHPIAFSTQFNIGPTSFVFLSQLPPDSSLGNFSANSAIFSLPLSFATQKFSFATAIQNYLIESNNDTSWYSNYPITAPQSCTAFSAETSYKTLFLTNNQYGPSSFQLYAGETIAEQINFSTKGLFRIDTSFKTPFGGFSAYIFSCDYGYIGSDANPQTTTVDATIQPQIKIPFLQQNTIDYDYIIISVTANYSIRPVEYKTNSFNTINSTLASSLQKSSPFIAFSTATILKKNDHTISISAQIKDLELLTDYKPIITDETTVLIHASSQIQFTYFDLNALATAQVCPSSIFSVLEQNYALIFNFEKFNIKANCSISDETINDWGITANAYFSPELTANAQINQNGTFKFSLKYVLKLIKK